MSASPATSHAVSNGTIMRRLVIQYRTAPGRWSCQSSVPRKQLRSRSRGISSPAPVERLRSDTSAVKSRLPDPHSTRPSASSAARSGLVGRFRHQATSRAPRVSARIPDTQPFASSRVPSPPFASVRCRLRLFIALSRHSTGTRRRRRSAPEMIIVAIENTDRNRDMMLVVAKGVPRAPRAEAFLGFLENELIPDIEKTYRTSQSRILAAQVVELPARLFPLPLRRPAAYCDGATGEVSQQSLG
jgi:hypothetical protein